MAQGIFLGVAVAEGNVVKTQLTAFITECNRVFRLLNGKLRRQHLLHTVCGNHGARHHNEDHRNHQERHDDLHRVLDIRHHVAYLHGGFRNGMPTHPHDEQRDKIHDEHHDRHCNAHHALGKAVCAGEVFIRLIKARLLEFLIRKRAYHEHAAQILAADEV